MMLILGIDPGTATTGYGLLKVEETIFDVLDSGLIETDKKGLPSVRLQAIHRKMSNLFTKFSPDVMAIEKLFFANNAKTAMRVGQAHGVILFCAAQHKTKVFEYAPGTIKKVVAGNGRADKKMMQQSLRRVLGAGVRSRPKKKTHFDNEADALAVALCHAYQCSENRNTQRTQ